MISPIKIRGQNFLTLILGLLFMILLSPVIIIGIVVFGGGHALGLVFSRLRNDPKNGFEFPIDFSKLWIGPNNPVLEDAERYFNELTSFIAKKSDSKASEIHKVFTELGDHYAVHAQAANSIVVTLTSIIERGEESVELSLSLDALPSANGSFTVEELVNVDEYKEDIESLASSTAVVVAKTAAHPKLTFNTNDNPLAVWFVIGILRGKLEFNRNTRQAWTYIEEKKVWIVQYDNEGRDYGLRNKKTDKRARRLWLDT